MIRGPNLPLHCVQHRHRFFCRPHQDSAERRARYRERHPNLRLDRVLQPPILHVRHQSDNFKHRLLHRVFKLRQLSDSHLSPDGILIPQVLFHERLVHNRQLPRSIHFRFREASSVHQLDFQRRKISLADQLKHCVPFFRVRFPRNLDVARNSPIRRKRARFRRLHDTWQRFQPLQQRPVKSRHLVRRFITVHRQGKPRHQDVIRLQSQVHFSQRHKAPHQQPRAHQQRQGKPHFQHHHGVAQPPVPEPAADSLAAIPQRFIQVFARRLQRWHQPEHQRRQHRCHQRERQYRHIHPDHRFRRNYILRH